MKLVTADASQSRTDFHIRPELALKCSFCEFRLYRKDGFGNPSYITKPFATAKLEKGFAIRLSPAMTISSPIVKRLLTLILASLSIASPAMAADDVKVWKLEAAK